MAQRLIGVYFIILFGLSIGCFSAHAKQTTFLVLANNHNRADNTYVVFRNATDATIKISELGLDGSEVISESLVAPKTVLTIVVPVRQQTFVLVAYLADPVRVHRVSLNLEKSGPHRFNIIPHIFGTYILKDAEPVNAIPAAPFAP